MSEDLRRKGNVGMTDMTILTCWHVVCRFNHRQGWEELTGVTAFAATGYTRVNIGNKG